MPYILDADPALTSPDHWEGFDIRDNALHEAVGCEPDNHLTNGSYRQAHRLFLRGLTRAINGDRTEVSFQEGTIFDPDTKQLADGSIVIIEDEMVSQWRYDDETTWSTPAPEAVTPSITDPFFSYWLEGQDNPAGSTLGFGYETATYTDELIRYGRNLAWGVVITSGIEERIIQPFPFALTQKCPDGTAVTVPPKRKFKELRHPPVSLPIEVGSVTLSGRMRHAGSSADFMKRVRSIEVVHATDPK